MVSLVNSKFVTDIVSWSLTHPKERVNLFFRRRTNGERYFTCSAPSYTGFRPLFLSCEELLRVFDEVSSWENKKFISNSVTNEWGIAISGGGPEDKKRITLVMSLHNNIESFELRRWWRNNTTSIFQSSGFGFRIKGKENIASFIKMREEIIQRIAEVNILDDLIKTAHHLLFRVYTENYMFDAQGASVMQVVDVEKFTILWAEEMKSPLYKDQSLKITARDIYTYVTTEGLTRLEEYVLTTLYSLSPMNHVQAC